MCCGVVDVPKKQEQNLVPHFLSILKRFFDTNSSKSREKKNAFLLLFFFLRMGVCRYLNVTFAYCNVILYRIICRLNKTGENIPFKWDRVESKRSHIVSVPCFHL